MNRGSVVTDEMADRLARASFTRLWPGADFDGLPVRDQDAYRAASKKDLEAALEGFVWERIDA